MVADTADTITHKLGYVPYHHEAVGNTAGISHNYILSCQLHNPQPLAYCTRNCKLMTMIKVSTSRAEADRKPKARLPLWQFNPPKIDNLTGKDEIGLEIGLEIGRNTEVVETVKEQDTPGTTPAVSNEQHPEAAPLYSTSDEILLIPSLTIHPYGPLPSNIRAVGHLQPAFITETLRDLYTLPCPSTYELTAAADFMWDAHSLLAIASALSAFGIATELTGEKNSILHFVKAPLSYSLRITGRTREDREIVWGDYPPWDHEYRRVWTHTDFQTKEWKITGVDKIGSIILYIFDVWQQLESNTGTFRPPSMCDAKLLEILRSRDLAQCQCFAEAWRAVKRRCLLDAVVELMTPFGLKPELDDEKSTVRFKNKILDCLEITRLDRYLDGESHEPAIDTGIILSCPRKFAGALADINSWHGFDRYLKFLNLQQSAPNNFPRHSSLFCLDNDGETLELVETLLVFRDVPFEIDNATRLEKGVWTAKSVGSGFTKRQCTKYCCNGKRVHEGAGSPRNSMIIEAVELMVLEHWTEKIERDQEQHVGIIGPINL
ncbi:hypothetical protein CC78DRAFT_33161 [Lojkania enalia]|uniref:Uncharacterized protein n=1 Tax=Lojkania enalia TaxID=147567 RepID=A0A9P4N935_9PLEO|nr:hypothetical protein CC78DRAFT_33161 [Didymosphaeria enalia]